MMSRWDSYITASIAVAMTAAFSFLFFGPQRRELAELQASIGALEEQLARRTINVSELSEIEKDLKQADDFLADYRTRIPVTADVGDFVEAVSAIAERLGIRDQNIAPLASKTRGPVTALPIRISFVAGFEAAFSFLREVERLPRIARVTELVVERSEPDENGTDGDLGTVMTMQIFYEPGRDQGAGEAGAGSRT